MYNFYYSFLLVYAQELDFRVITLFTVSFINLHIVLHSSCINLHSQQCRRILFFPHPFQLLLFLDFLMIVILTSVKWCLILVLICSSNNIVMFSILPYVCWLFVHIFQRNVRSSTHFLIGLFMFWYWAPGAVYILLILIYFQLFHLQIFYLIQRVIFHLVYGFLCYAKAFKFN